MLASFGVTSPAGHHVDGIFASGSLGRATPVKVMTPDSASLRTVVGTCSMCGDTAVHGEGGSRSGREERYHLTRLPGKQCESGGFTGYYYE